MLNILMDISFADSFEKSEEEKSGKKSPYSTYKSQMTALLIENQKAGIATEADKQLAKKIKFEVNYYYYYYYYLLFFQNEIEDYHLVVLFVGCLQILLVHYWAGVRRQVITKLNWDETSAKEDGSWEIYLGPEKVERKNTKGLNLLFILITILVLKIPRFIGIYFRYWNFLHSYISAKNNFSKNQAIWIHLWNGFCSTKQQINQHSKQFQEKGSLDDNTKPCNIYLPSDQTLSRKIASIISHLTANNPVTTTPWRHTFQDFRRQIFTYACSNQQDESSVSYLSY